MTKSRIRYVFVALIRRLPVVLSALGIGIGLMLLAANVLPRYRASADLVIVNGALPDATFSEPDVASIITSTEVLSAVSRLKLATDASDLAKNIKVEVPAQSSVVEISYEDRDAERAAFVMSAVVDQATAYFNELARRGYTDVIAALNAGVIESRDRVAVYDRLLQQAATKSNATSSREAVADLSKQIGELRAQSGKIDASLAADRAAASALQSRLKAIDPSMDGDPLHKDNVDRQLQARLAREVEALISAEGSLDSSSPVLADLARRVSQDRNQLKSVEAIAIESDAGSTSPETTTIFDAASVAGLLAADNERLRVTNAELAADQKYFKQVASARAAIDGLRAKRAAASQQYVRLLRRLNAAKCDAEQGASFRKLIVVRRAIPGRANIPAAVIVGSFALVVAFAVGAAFCVDAFDRRLWGVREIEGVYGRKVYMELEGRS